MMSMNAGARERRSSNAGSRGTRPTWLCAALIAAAAITVSGQRAAFVQVGSIPGPADFVKAQGEYAYIAAGRTLTIVDVRDPAAPKRAGSYAFPEMIWGLTLSGNLAYVAADTAGLVILDVSNPAAPVLRGTLKTPGQAKSVALASNTAYVADHVRGIDVVSLASPAAPMLSGSVFVDGFAKDLVMRGSVLYEIDQPNGLNVFDAGTPALAPLGSLTLSAAISLRPQLDVSETGVTPRLAVVSGGGPIQIYDVTDAKAPKAVTSYRTPGNAQRVQVKGSDLYVADGPAGLQVVSLATPAMPAITATFKTPMQARDVAVSGSLVFVVSGPDVLILRRTP
jgi:hypothetical protein